MTEEAPTDGEVYEYIRALAKQCGAPPHVLDDIGPPLDQHVEVWERRQ